MIEAWYPQEWKALYAAAMLEFDPGRLPRLIELADAAIQARLTELTEMPTACSEHLELRSALKVLSRVKDSLAFY